MFMNYITICRERGKKIIKSFVLGLQCKQSLEQISHAFQTIVIIHNIFFIN